MENNKSKIEKLREIRQSLWKFANSLSNEDYFKREDSFGEVFEAVDENIRKLRRPMQKEKAYREALPID